MGRAIIERLHTKHTCIGLARPSKELRSLKTDFNCTVYECNVTDASAVEATFERIIQNHGTIDALINSAGIWIEGSLETNTAEVIERAVTTNILGTIYPIRAALPTMKKQRAGLIVNIGSQAGLRVKSDRSVYTATKWAITGLTRSLNEELGPQNIRVTALYPGTTDTEFFVRAGVTKDVSQGLKPEDIAETVEWLLSLPPSVTISDLGIKATIRG